MAISPTIEKYLNEMQIPYQVLPHMRTGSSLHTATVAHVPARQIAKGVLLEDESGYLMAVVPATYHVHLGALRQQLGRQVGLATEQDVAQLFTDCDRGAIPPVGDAYGIETVVDEDLMDAPEVYFEAGDHEELIRLQGSDFMRLNAQARRGHFCTI